MVSAVSGPADRPVEDIELALIIRNDPIAVEIEGVRKRVARRRYEAEFITDGRVIRVGFGTCEHTNIERGMPESCSRSEVIHFGNRHTEIHSQRPLTAGKGRNIGLSLIVFLVAGVKTAAYTVIGPVGVVVRQVQAADDTAVRYAEPEPLTTADEVFLLDAERKNQTLYL